MIRRSILVLIATLILFACAPASTPTATPPVPSQQGTQEPEGTALPPEQPTSAETPISTIVGTIAAVTPEPSEEGRPFNLLGQIGGSAYAVAVEGNIAYLGQGPRLITLDVSQPSAPRLMGMSEVLRSGPVRGVHVADGYAYVATIMADYTF